MIHLTRTNIDALELYVGFAVLAWWIWPGLPKDGLFGRKKGDTGAPPAGTPEEIAVAKKLGIPVEQVKGRIRPPKGG